MEDPIEMLIDEERKIKDFEKMYFRPLGQAVSEAEL